MLFGWVRVCTFSHLGLSEATCWECFGGFLNLNFTHSPASLESWEPSLWQQCPCWAERIGEPCSSYRTFCVLACAAATHYSICVHVCVCVFLLNMHSLWDLCIRCCFIGELWMRTAVILNLHKQAAGLRLCGCDWSHLWQGDLSLSRGMIC